MIAGIIGAVIPILVQLFGLWLTSKVENKEIQRIYFQLIEKLAQGGYLKSKKLADQAAAQLKKLNEIPFEPTINP